MSSIYTKPNPFYIPPFRSQEDWTEENINLVKSSIETGKIRKSNVLRAIIGNQSKKFRRLENGDLETIYIFEILRDEKKNIQLQRTDVDDFFESNSGFLHKFFKGSELIISNSVDKKIDALFKDYAPLPYNADELALLKFFGVDNPHFIEKDHSKKHKGTSTQYKQDDTTRASLKKNINVFINTHDSRFGIFKKKIMAYFKGKAKYDHFVNLYMVKYPTLNIESAGRLFLDELTKALSLIEKENELFMLLSDKFPSEKESVSFKDKTNEQQIENHLSIKNTYKATYDDISLYLAGPSELISEVRNYQKYLKYKAKYLALKSKLHM
jgi:hypothetical protein